MNRSDKIEFSDVELQRLCQLFMEGKLSVSRENDLKNLLLLQRGNNSEYAEVLKLMALERNIARSGMPSSKSRNLWLHISVAASFLILLAISYFITPLESSESMVPDATYIVWMDGKMITGADARIIAESYRNADLKMLEQFKVEQDNFLNDELFIAIQETTSKSLSL